jgi:hypothetical protein
MEGTSIKSTGVPMIQCNQMHAIASHLHYIKTKIYDKTMIATTQTTHISFSNGHTTSPLNTNMSYHGGIQEAVLSAPSGFFENNLSYETEPAYLDDSSCCHFVLFHKTVADQD